jgi:hypothetical protein
MALDSDRSSDNRSQYDSDEYESETDDEVDKLDSSYIGNVIFPTTEELLSFPTCTARYENSYNWEPKNGCRPLGYFMGPFSELNKNVVMLTQEQGTKDWHLLRQRTWGMFEAWKI